MLLFTISRSKIVLMISTLKALSNSSKTSEKSSRRSKKKRKIRKLWLLMTIIRSKGTSTISLRQLQPPTTRFLINSNILMEMITSIS